MQQGQKTIGYCRTQTIDSEQAPKAVTTITHCGPGFAVVDLMSREEADSLLRKELAHMLYLSAARFARRSDVRAISSPIFYGDAYPPADFSIEYDENEKPLRYVVEAAIAGLPKDEIDVIVDKFERTILIECGMKNAKDLEKKKQYLHKGIASRCFRKWLIAPEKSDLDKVSIEYQDGILKIVIPLMENDPNKIHLKIKS